MESQTKFLPFGPLGSETGENAEGVIRRLRDSLEISGHDKNHPHAAAPQPDQDRLHGWRSLSSTCLRFHEVFKETSLRFAITSFSQGVDLQMTKRSRCHRVYVSAIGSAWCHLDSLKQVELKSTSKVARTCKGEVIVNMLSGWFVKQVWF